MNLLSTRLFLIAFLSFVCSFSQQFCLITDTLKDPQSSHILADTEVKVWETNDIVSSDQEGCYELSISEGSYTISYKTSNKNTHIRTLSVSEDSFLSSNEISREKGKRRKNTDNQGLKALPTSHSAVMDLVYNLEEIFFRKIWKL